MPVVGAIDYYGFNKVQRETIRKIVNVKEGDRFPSSKAEAEERILQNGGVAEAHLEAVCCSDGKLILYIGIEERGGAHFDVREPPEGESILPEEVTTAYQQYRGALENAAHNGITSEDLTQGYSLSADPDVRALQQKFPALVKKYSGALREVLRSSFDENQRMAAVTLLAYNATRRESVTD